jgi:predicted ATP-dependent endonuclease of OLD family
MRIAQIEILDFRGVKGGVITLPEHGVLLGPNNVGKTGDRGAERLPVQLS